MADLPPWLNPSAAQGYGQLAAEGMRIRQSGQNMAQQESLARAKLAQDAQELNQKYQLTVQEMQQKKEMFDQSKLMQEQQLQIEKSYKEQVLALQQEELKSKQAQIDFQTRQAAETYAKQKSYTDEVTAGADPYKTLLKYGPGMFHTGEGGFGSAAHALAPPQNKAYLPEPVNQNPNIQVMHRGDGSWYEAFIPGSAADRSISRADMARLNILKAQRKSLSDALITMPESSKSVQRTKMRETLQHNMDMLDKDINGLLNKSSGGTNAPSSGKGKFTYNPNTGGLDPNSDTGSTQAEPQPDEGVWDDLE